MTWDVDNISSAAIRDHQPSLVVIAGANGAGKTSFTRRVLKHEWLEGAVYVNPDEIARSRYGDWDSPEAVLKAAQFAERTREECLETGRSLAFETVFSTSEKVEFVRAARKTGFFVRLFYVGTDSPIINIGRVGSRVLEGGHDVPIPKIISRFGKSNMNLREIIGEVDRAYVYDNSVENDLPTLQFRTRQGIVQRVYEDGEHPWADVIRMRLPSLHQKESAQDRSPVLHR